MILSMQTLKNLTHLKRASFRVGNIRSTKIIWAFALIMMFAGRTTEDVHLQPVLVNTQNENISKPAPANEAESAEFIKNIEDYINPVSNRRHLRSMSDFGLYQATRNHMEL